MKDDRLLKQVTICSVFLLCMVLAFSKQIRHTVSSAGELQEVAAPTAALQVSAQRQDGLPGEMTPVPRPVPPTATPSVTPEPTPTLYPGWEQVAGAVESEMPVALGEECVLVIEKSQTGFERATWTMQDDPVNRTLTFTIDGVTTEEGIAPEQIQRIAQGDYHNGTPPTPTPTMSPTPTPQGMTSAAATAAAVSPTPTPIGGIPLSEDDPLYPWRNDPLQGLSNTQKLQEDGTTTITLAFTMKHVYEYQVYEDEWNYYIRLQRPRELYDKIIVIDAGHGGLDSGTVSLKKDYYEKTMNLSIVLFMKEFFDAQDEIKVYYTRTTDWRPSLEQRIELANDLEADFFLSVHCNANETHSLNGTEVLYSSAQNSWTGMNSIRFAQICLDAMDEYLGLKNRGLVAREHNLTVLHDALVPAALVEVAFMSNTSDMEVLAKEENRRKIAEGLYEAVLRSFEEMEAMAEE